MSARRPPPTALLAALALVLLQWPVWTGASGPVGDAATFHLPYQMLVGDFARQGELLTWNPWTNGGSPDGAEPQVGACSPIAVLCGLLGGGTPWSWVLLWLVPWALSAAGFARLARHLGAPAWAQVLLALAWASNGAFTGHACHTCFVHAFAMLPWMVLLLDRALLRRGAERLRLAASAGAFWGLGALAGYPGVVMVCGLVLLGWTAVRVLTRDAPDEVESRPGDARAGVGAAALCLAVTTAVALLVLAPTYAAFFVEGNGFTGRTAPLPRETATGWNSPDPQSANPLEPAALWTVAHPGLAGLAATMPQGTADDPFPITSRSSVGLDTGLGTWVLVLVALAGGRRSPRRLGLLLLGLLFLGTALGTALPLRAWLYDLVPPTRYFRHPAIFRIGFLFAIAALAALGARRLEPRVLARAAFAATGLLGAAAIAAYPALDVPLRATDALWLGALLATALATGVLAMRGRDAAARRGVGALLALGVLAATLLNEPLLHAPPDRMQQFAQEHDPSLDLGAAGFDRQLLAATIPAWKTEAILAGDHERIRADLESPVARLFDSANLPAKTPVLFGYAAMNSGYHYGLAYSVRAMRLGLGRERVFFAADALHRPLTPEDFQAWVDAIRDDAVLPLLVHDRDESPADLAAAIRAARLRPIGFAVERYTPTVLELSVAPQPGAGWLLVTERFARGWRATVDGTAVPVHTGCFLWRAVELPAGARRVRFEYAPFGWPGLQLLSAATLVLLAAAAVHCAWRARRHTAAA